MYAKKNQGHGICGARNIYSAKVKIDNWVEDEVGMNLSRNPRPPITSYRTNTGTSYIAPSEWPEPAALPAKMPTTLELKTKNKEGMSYALLFEHDNAHASIKDRFTSTTKLTLMSRGNFPPTSIDQGELSRQKSRRVLEDIKHSNGMTTESRSASSHLLLNYYKTEDRNIVAAEIPNFRRYGALTSTIPTAF